MAATRLYEVRDTSLLESAPPQLVEASSQAHAIRHVASKYVATVPDTKRAVELVNAGIKVETAK